MNITSNEYDQAPKTGVQYEERLTTMSGEIIEAMESEFIEIEGSDELLHWIGEHKEKLPLSLVVQSLQKGKPVTLELRRDVIKKSNDDRRKTIGAPISIEDLDLGIIYHAPQTTFESLQASEIVTMIRFSQKNGKISAEMFQLQQSSTTMIPSWVKYLRNEDDINMNDITL